MSEPSSAPPSASSEEDRATVAAAVGGDQRAYERLLTKYQGPLRRHVGKMVRDQGQVDDLVQEAFVKAFSNIESYNPAYAFSTWLYRITTNHTIDYIRKKKLPTFSIDKPVQTRDGQLQMELPDSTYRPDRAIVTDQRNEILSAAIAELPEKYHRVIVMRHQQEMTYEEIATELDLPLGTVKAHIFRARALLNKALRARRAELE
ncbi:RNA polymerase subunit sigma-24 [Rubrivirga sp. SAORIC476]|uniref:RNA polymerase sigma factor n=1 Tax=Rubrivirga sp. SAORIC476 TaxID=1961794 RepID=UPI000BA93D70|nr:sigma-70 family RNA polymerase sigma factor [Rubrivirga sp. SAORIC476]PAP79027.1 RNA polymerase subunit sigma-24 [Rubrivirga sp. SAORIC476]